MEREIKFRGMDTDSNRWFYGHYYEIPAPLQCIGKPDEPECYIVFENPHSCPDWNMPRQMVRCKVKKDTAGQYTGLKNKNGVEIYEGDIIECKNHGKLNQFVTNGEDFKGKVEFQLGLFCVNFNESYNILSNWNYHCEVIGNIYQNPELLEVTND